MKAQDFFLQLETFSARARKYLNGKPDLSAWGEARLKTASGYPDGIVLHYTAGPTLESAVKWLCNTRDQCGSTHVVVADSALAWAKPMMVDTPLVAALPATVVQLRLPNSMAYHATVANGTHYGIEMANNGPMPPRQSDPTNAQVRNLAAINCVVAAEQVFTAYRLAQVQAVSAVGRYVAALGGNLQAHTIVGHEHVQGPRTINGGGHDKRDPGVCFNFAAIRDAIVNPAAPAIKDASLQTLQQRGGNDPDFFRSAFQARPKSGQEIIMAAQMVALGYHVYPGLGSVGATSTGNLQYFSGPNDNNKKNKETVAMFQRLMGLTSDGVPGPITAAALAERLSDRWIKRTMLDVA